MSLDVTDTENRFIAQLDAKQFKRLDLLLNGLVGAVNRLTDRLVEGDAKQVEAINNLSENVGKWLAIISEKQPPVPKPPGPPAKVGSVKFIFPGLKEEST